LGAFGDFGKTFCEFLDVVVAVDESFTTRKYQQQRIKIAFIIAQKEIM